MSVAPGGDFFPPYPKRLSVDIEALTQEADFDSHGQFDIDLARARQKLDQHLELSHPDYLAFLIQAAYALGATRLRLTRTWRTYLWEFDGQSLSRIQLDSLVEHADGALATPLQRLQMALILLSKGPYSQFSYLSGLATSAYRIQFQRGKFSPAVAASGGPLSHRLEIAVRFKTVGGVLPEFACLAERLPGCPVHLEVPFSAPQENPSVAFLELRSQGKSRLPGRSAFASLHTLEFQSRSQHSFLFWLGPPQCLRVFCLGLGYPQPNWGFGQLWLYSDEMRTDLSQKALVGGPLLERVVAQVENELAEMLSQAFQTQAILEQCRATLLESWQLAPIPIANCLAQLALFPTAQHGPHSLHQLDALYLAQDHVLHFCLPEQLPLPQLEEAPPVVVMSEDVESILTQRFQDRRTFEELFHRLSIRENHQRQWRERSPEELLVEGAEISTQVQIGDWFGQIAMLKSKVPARLDIFKDNRWLASMNPGPAFPSGLVGRLTQKNLPVNASWTEPEGQAWSSLVTDLPGQVANWLAPLVTEHAWLQDRMVEMALECRHLEVLERVPIFEGQSLQEMRQKFWGSFAFAAPPPSWALMRRAFPQLDRLQWDTYLQRIRNWSSSLPSQARLTSTIDWVAWICLPSRGEMGFSPNLPNNWVAFFRDGRILAQVEFQDSPLPAGLGLALEDDTFVPNAEWNNVWVERAKIEGWVRADLPHLLDKILEGQHPQRCEFVLGMLAWAETFEGHGIFCRDGHHNPVFWKQVLRQCRAGEPQSLWMNVQEAPPGPHWVVPPEVGQALRKAFPQVHWELLRPAASLELPDHPWIEQIELVDIPGRLGLRRLAGPANQCKLSLICHGRVIAQPSLELCPGRLALRSPFCLEAVLEVENENFSLNQIRDLIRWQSCLFQSREFVWERLALEAGARGAANTGFTLDLDSLRFKMLHLPVFDLGQNKCSLADLQILLDTSGTLSYVRGSTPRRGDLGAVLYIESTQLVWLKLLFGSQLRDLTALQPTSPLHQPPPELGHLPNLDYLVRGKLEGVAEFGLQRSLGGWSKLRWLRDGKVIESQQVQWPFEIEACIQAGDLPCQADGGLVRNHLHSQRLQELMDLVVKVLTEERPSGYLLRLALRNWDGPYPWVEPFLTMPLLPLVQGGMGTLSDWRSGWSGPLPYLPADQNWSDNLDLLPEHPVALLGPSELEAGRNLKLKDYSDSIRKAWQCSQLPLAEEPPETTYQDQKVRAEFHWETQRILFLWRGRVVHHMQRRRWPGFEMRLTVEQPSDFSPAWGDFDLHLKAYWKVLKALLSQQDLLDESIWGTINVPLQGHPPGPDSPLDEETLRHWLGWHQAQWNSRAHLPYQPLLRTAEIWHKQTLQLIVAASSQAYQIQGQDFLLDPTHDWWQKRSLGEQILRLSLDLHRKSGLSCLQAAQLHRQVLCELNLLTEELSPPQQNIRPT